MQRRTPLTAKTGIGSGNRTVPPPAERPRFRVDPAAAARALTHQAESAAVPRDYKGPVPDVSKAAPRPFSTGFPPVVRQTIIDRDHMRCVRCGHPIDSGSRGYSLQHRDNRGMGGTRDPRINLPSNGIVLCGSGTTDCHGWVEEHETEAARCGWVVLSWADPTTVPVLMFTGRWMLLSDQGTAWLAADPTGGDAHADARRKAPLP